MRLPAFGFHKTQEMSAPEERLDALQEIVIT
jgi:hypothetical protein